MVNISIPSVSESALTPDTGKLYKNKKKKAPDVITTLPTQEKKNPSYHNRMVRFTSNIHKTRNTDT